MADYCWCPGILARHDVRGVIFGHAAAGTSTSIRSSTCRETTGAPRARRILDETTDLVARLGGTPSGEHGDGRLRTPLLDRVWDPRAREEFALVKNSFDPSGILNPGVKVPLEGTGHPLSGDIKYDPALPPLPPRARAALDRVDHARAYAEFRLGMLGAEGAG